MDNEIWREIENYPGYYVSDMGRVKSYRQGERILKVARDNYGYPTVVLCNKDGRHTFTVHRLVAKAFIPLVKGKNEVDHINRKRDDNRVENLRWVTRKENANNPLSIIAYRNTKSIYAALEKVKRPVAQLLGDKVIAEYNSIRDAERATGVGHQNINYVLKGRCKVAGGYGWRRLD